MKIVCKVGELSAAKGITVEEISEATGLPMWKAEKLLADEFRSMFKSTMAELCELLDCTPGELFVLKAD